MAKAIPLDQALKFWFAMILSMVWLYFGGQLSDFLIAEPASFGSRWGGVFTAVLALVPWLLFIAWSLSVTDEYHRQIVLIGSAIAFIGDLLMHVAFNVMQDARIVSWSTHLAEVPAAIIVWMLSMTVVLLYYRFRP